MEVNNSICQRSPNKVEESRAKSRPRSAGEKCPSCNWVNIQCSTMKDSLFMFKWLPVFRSELLYDRCDDHMKWNFLLKKKITANFHPYYFCLLWHKNVFHLVQHFYYHYCDCNEYIRYSSVIYLGWPSQHPAWSTCLQQMPIPQPFTRQ